MPAPALLTLTTDFGEQDGYVAAMKGAMLRVEPRLRFVDVSHLVAPCDVMEGAFVLRQAAPYFPAGTVHLAVVDPGVGTPRRALAARFRFGDEAHVFVGPDNGLLALLLDGAEPEAVVVLDRPAFWGTPEPARTFHGRDVFAPVAAHLAAGRPLADVGSAVRVDAIQRLHWALPLADAQGVQGWVVHVDRFGNGITNIPAALMNEQRAGRAMKSYVGTAILEGIFETYASVGIGEPLVLVGSSGCVEIGVNGGNAAALLSLHKGSPVSLVFAE